MGNEFTTVYRWLHLTDLHLGMGGQESLWPNMEHLFLEDLKYLREKVGPWDLVLFTGDLTQRGTAREFAALDGLLQKLWSSFADWGCTPQLLAVPGNHDLVRPTDESDPALITLLHNWQIPAVQTPFWKDPDCPQRRLVSAAFQGFTDWWESTAIPRPPGLNPGVLPGDWSVSIDTGSFRLGILGLNSTYLQLAGGDFTRKLHLDLRQFHGAYQGQGPDWTQRHDACLLLTHHPVAWLSTKAQDQFADEIHAPPERFALHLFGHMHEANLRAVALGGSAERRSLQGCSVFGLETWGDNEVREHGYSLCELKLEDGELRLRIWPRRAIRKQGGGRRLERDQSFTLDERDGGTYPVVVAHPRPDPARQRTHRPTPPDPAAPAAAPPLPSGSVADYDPRKRVFSVPYRQKGDQVVGREEALERVRRQLSAGRRTAIGQTAVFQGLGGLGKTQLAVEYAYRYRDDYPGGVIWLTADQDLDAQLIELAVKARWIAPESEHRFKLEIARHRLRSVSDCLIVFDNLEDPATIRDYLPEPPANPHILVTSRDDQPDFIAVPIDLLDLDQSLRMLTQEAGREPDGESERDAALEIARTLGGLPLALELAGAYLARRAVGFQRYLELLRHDLKQALPARFASLTRHEADLYATLQISAGAFAEEPQLRPVLDVLTWSGPGPMGLDLLAKLVGVEDPADLTGALGLGTALHILQSVPGTDRYALHRLVREVRREQIPIADRADWAAELCGRINGWFSALRDDFLQLPRFEAEMDHLREWHDHAVRLAPRQAVRLTWLQAYPPFHQGRPQEIQRCIERALIEHRQQGCDEAALLANLLNDLAYSMNALGDAKGALELNEKALAIQRAILGDQHPDTAKSLNNIAEFTNILGDPKRALELAEEALAIQRGLFGDRHPDTARSLNNIAIHTHTLGQPQRALKLAEQALAIHLDLFGNQHPDTARSLNNIAFLTNALDGPQRALELAERALAIRRDLFGNQHPQTAGSLNNVASYTNALGNSKRALDLAEQALVIQRDLFGDRHPAIACSLHNTAGYLKDLHKPNEAFSRAKAAYAMQRQLLGADHPDTLSTARLLNQIKLPGFRVPPSTKGGGGGKRRKSRR